MPEPRLNIEKLAWLRDHGLDHKWRVNQTYPTKFAFEPPSRVRMANLLHEVTIGAFSYLVDGYIYRTNIGRYCSIARDVVIGPGSHPLDWVSTHPFQFSDSAKCDVGNKFPGSEKYHSHNFTKQSKRASEVRSVNIGNDVWIANGVFIRPGISIGHGAVVAAKSVVTRDVPPYAIVGGNPAKIIRYRFPTEIVERLLALEWWKYAEWDLTGIQFHDTEKAIETIGERVSEGLITPFRPGWVTTSDIEELPESYIWSTGNYDDCTAPSA